MLDELHLVLAPYITIPSFKRRTSKYNKGLLKKAKKGGGKSEAIRNPLLEGGAAGGDEEFEVESRYEEEEDV